MPKLTKYVSTMTIRFGPMAFSGSLTGVRKSKSKESGFKMVTPDGKPVQQVYVPQGADLKANPDLFLKEDLEFGIVTDEAVTVVSSENVAAAKQSVFPKNVLTCTVHEAAEVEDQLFPSDNNGYVFTPDASDKTNLEYYKLVFDLLDMNPGKALVGICNLKNNEGLYRVTIWHNRLTLQRMLYPEDINEYEDDGVEIGFTGAMLKKGAELLDTMTKPFDADTYQNAVKANVVALQGQALDGEVEFTPEVNEAPSSVDIMALLDSFEVV